MPGTQVRDQRPRIGAGGAQIGDGRRAPVLGEPPAFGVWLSAGDNNVFTQIGLIVLLVMRFKGARLAASGLGAFGLSYAWFASFFAAMSFADVWI